MPKTEMERKESEGTAISHSAGPYHAFMIQRSAITNAPVMKSPLLLALDSRCLIVT